MPQRVAISIDVELPVVRISELLSVLGDYGIRATFFVIGKILKSHKKLISSILNEEHELAVHGYEHTVWKESGSKRKEDVLKAIQTFRQVIDEPLLGFRAPYGNINEAIMNLLEENEILYDSSIIPTFLRVEGVRKVFLNSLEFVKVPAIPYHPSRKNITSEGEMKIVEIPFSVLPITRLPIGFGYTMLFGADFFKFFTRYFKEDLMTFYMHSYELHKGAMSLGAPPLVRPYYRRNTEPLMVLKEFLEFLNSEFSPRFVLLREEANNVRSRSENVNRKYGALRNISGRDF